MIVVAASSWAGLVVQDRIEHGCQDNPFGCGALVQLLGTVVGLAIAFGAFAYWRVFVIADHHRRTAHEEVSRAVHPVEPSPKDKKRAKPGPRIVGRDSICKIIEDDLREEKPRPQVIVGGVGVGKTAVLLRLGEFLADRGAVPVPVRLREAPPDFSLFNLAGNHFRERVGTRVLSAEEGDKIWRKLCNDRRVVVLADGLEEALIGHSDRVQIIGSALAQAQEQRLRVVIASRPDEALQGIDAAVIRLEPLAASEALDYLSQSMGEATQEDARPLAQIAEMAETPFYLRVARELSKEEIHELIATYGDRLPIRVGLLERWIRRLVRRELLGDVRIVEEDRQAVIDELGQPACEALAEDRLEFQFARSGASAMTHARFVTAERLGIVENVAGAARFKHSIMQAYVGARHLPGLLEDPAIATRYINKGLDEPGREFLMALTMACCIKPGDTPEFRTRRRDELCGVIRTMSSAETFDVLAAAYEIDALVGKAGRDSLAEAADQAWSRCASGSGGQAGDLKMVAAKLRAVTRIEESATKEAYGALWKICLKEDNYRVRLHAAQALGAGGNTAFEVIRDEVRGFAAVEELMRACSADSATQPAVRQWCIQGWTLPLLASTCEEQEAREICDFLKRWAGLAGRAPHLGVQTCLAQGLKYEANRLPTRGSPEMRVRLIGVAKELLKGSSWWYSDIALLQALALWSLDSRVDHMRLLDSITPYTRRLQHPFVRATAALCAKAVTEHARARQKRRHPSHYIWIDETGVVGKIGADSVPSDRDLWVPEAAGWRSLVPEARGLVADVFLYLNLIEHGEALALDPDERVRQRELRRMAVADGESMAVADGESPLPQCIAHSVHRKRLLVNRQEEECCKFGLCPYPKKGQSPFRGELGETFCREQQRLLRARRVRLAVRLGDEPLISTLQRRNPGEELTDFWQRMESRAQEPMNGALS